MADHLPIVPPSVPADVPIDADRVRALLEHRFPGRFAASTPIRPFTSGWDNALFAIGGPEQLLLARLPRRAVGAEALRREARVLPAVADHLPLPTPWPAEHCAAALDYPYPWALTPFHPGRPAAISPLDTPACADQLFAFLKALHRPAPDSPDVPTDGFRAAGLGPRAESTLAWLADLPDEVGHPLRRTFERALGATSHAGPRVWTHSDLHPFNLLVRDGHLAAVLDWGDAYAGDPAPDLAAPWMLLDPHHHGPFRELHGQDAWWRGAGWAVVYAATLTRAASEGATGFLPVATATIRRLVAHAPRRTD